ncbi:MAG: hypothetical protein EF811_03840 [Methanonatronarchaeia archaeon]|nr:MAG: hypothetical protein EF811_03840 [Methanonatronarchaeia archaeon]
MGSYTDQEEMKEIRNEIIEYMPSMDSEDEIKRIDIKNYRYIQSRIDEIDFEELGIDTDKVPEVRDKTVRYYHKFRDKMKMGGRDKENVVAICLYQVLLEEKIPILTSEFMDKMSVDLKESCFYRIRREFCRELDLPYNVDRSEEFLRRYLDELGFSPGPGFYKRCLEELEQVDRRDMSDHVLAVVVINIVKEIESERSFTQYDLNDVSGVSRVTIRQRTFEFLD